MVIRNIIYIFANENPVAPSLRAAGKVRSMLCAGEAAASLLIELMLEQARIVLMHNADNASEGRYERLSSTCENLVNFLFDIRRERNRNVHVGDFITS